MLTDIHAALQRLIWEYGRISPDEVDILSEAPTRERMDRLVRPTVSLFLFDLVENTELRQSNFPSARVGDHAERRMPPRRMDLRYMVSALTSEIEDEHRLLWRVLATLMKYPQLPGKLLPEELRTGEIPVTTKTNQTDDGRRLMDVWSGLSVTPHPAIYYVVTAPLDLDLVVRSPLVLTRTLRYRRLADGSPADDATTDIGGTLRDANGEPIAGARIEIEDSAREPVTTDGAGAYRLANVAEGKLRLRVTSPDGQSRTVTLTAPATSYDISLE